MTIGTLVNLMRGGIEQVFIIILPILSAAVVIGLIVAIFQATTSIQEQTLTFLPKFVVILAVIALLGGLMFSGLGQYTILLLSRIPDFAK